MLQIWRIKIEFNMSPKAKIKIIMCSYGSAHICGKTTCLRFWKVSHLNALRDFTRITVLTRNVLKINLKDRKSVV